MVSVGVSIVSHGQKELVCKLLHDVENQLKNGKFKVKILITENTQDIWEYQKIKERQNIEVAYKYNLVRRGFGANHNAAFEALNADYFFIVNPDVQLRNTLDLNIIINELPKRGIWSAKIINTMGVEISDAMRSDISVKNMAKRYFLKKSEPEDSSWFAGIFLGFDAAWYRNLNGFDEKFFMYVEDCDICQRSNVLGGELFHSKYEAVHDERRYSLRNKIHFVWHVKSLFYYLVTKKLRKLVYNKNVKST